MIVVAVQREQEVRFHCLFKEKLLTVFIVNGIEVVYF